MKLLLDEDLSPAHAVRLRAAGHDAIAVLEAGLGGQSDEIVREFAMRERRTLVTLDSDFGRILRLSPESTPGVIWLRPWPPTERVIEAMLDGAIRQLTDTTTEGKLVVVDPGRIRIR